ncbi:MAG: anthranilate phosphoribosyltransferase [bacterium]
MFETWLARLKEGKDLSRQQAALCLEFMLTDEADALQIQTVLEAFILKGEVESELLGFSDVLMRHVTPLARTERPVLELCGTGGSGQERFNISTTVAFLCSSLGISVAKHGNVGSLKANGSFDFLQALEINIDGSAQDAVADLDRYELCFLFARVYHPVLKKLAPIRKAIGKRSIFNLLGPLCNPARPDYQVLGCTTLAAAELLASTLQGLDRKRAFVLVGAGGCDEVSLQGVTKVLDVSKQEMSAFEVDPDKLGIRGRAYPCGTAYENAALFHQVFSEGDMTHPLAKHVALSAALPLWMMDKVPDVKSGYALASAQIANGGLYQQYLAFKDKA